jgi:hypothetical protein
VSSGLCTCNEGWELNLVVAKNESLCMRKTGVIPVLHKMYACVLVYNCLMQQYWYSLKNSKQLRVERVCRLTAFIGLICTVGYGSLNKKHEVFAGSISTFFFFFSLNFFNFADYWEGRKQTGMLKDLHENLGEDQKLEVYFCGQNLFQTICRVILVLTYVSCFLFLVFDVLLVVKVTMTLETFFATLSLLQAELTIRPLRHILEDHGLSSQLGNQGSIVLSKIRASVDKLKHQHAQARRSAVIRTFFTLILLMNYLALWMIYVAPIALTLVATIHGYHLTSEVIAIRRTARLVATTIILHKQRTETSKYEKKEVATCKTFLMQTRFDDSVQA